MFIGYKPTFVGSMNLRMLREYPQVSAILDLNMSATRTFSFDSQNDPYIR